MIATISVPTRSAVKSSGKPGRVVVVVVVVAPTDTTVGCQTSSSSLSWRVKMLTGSTIVILGFLFCFVLSCFLFCFLDS